VIDVGNSYVKVGFFRDGRLVVRMRISYDRIDFLTENVDTFRYDRGLLISVVPSVGNYLLSRLKKLQLLKPKDLPIKSTYSLESVGADRIAAAYPLIRRRRNGMVIVCGSAITINLVVSGVFYGGPILPSFKGLEVGYSSLAMMGKKLHPDSSRAINEGIRYAILGGVREATRVLERRFDVKERWITGGCAKEIRTRGRFMDDLILVGGKMILEDFYR